jgi:hypothetical protein
MQNPKIGLDAFEPPFLSLSRQEAAGQARRATARVTVATAARIRREYDFDRVGTSTISR